jgi:NAD(P)-dependent dehydrogenase (short-subunit alcohol dehydrogenase family)
LALANFNGKKSIVFGGTSGIGLETAKLLHQAGAEVVTVSRRGAISDQNEDRKSVV